jgi:hypothetical protein
VQARVAIHQHLKDVTPGDRQWHRHGVQERYYYKLLERFAPKVGGRYQVDDEVNRAIRAYLDQRGQRVTRQSSSMKLLMNRGFRKAAARKWLQRHPIDQIRSARPRRSSLAKDEVR